MTSLRQIFLRKDYVFISSFLLFRLIFEAQLKVLATWSGATHLYLNDVVQDNELVLQVLSLVCVFVVLYWSDLNAPGIVNKVLSPAFWARLYRDKIAHIEGATVNRGLFQGFLVSSAVMALSVLMGALILESGALKIDSFFRLAPFLVSELLLLAIWVLLLEYGRKVFWFAVKDCQKPGVAATSGTGLVVCWEAWMLFQVFNGSPFLQDRLVTFLLCLLVAAASLLWLQFGEAHMSERMRKNTRIYRMTFFYGLYLSYFHIYGQPFGYSRQVSLLYSASGSFWDLSSLGEKGPPGQLLSILAIILLVNALLQKTLKLFDQRV